MTNENIDIDWIFPYKEVKPRRHIIIPWSNPECTFENLKNFKEAYCDGDLHAWLIPLYDT